ncbi:hypothetical protein EXIGLDRAFT_846795 [Exidia glandulosa HHB12029]|uniref:Uncharacterized protein n=1 Tax=Exidia glandulosa HHB12029 TaxID=1314781 RepID=A0A166NHL6_EXIGL|nr:hypothetical protein EXIGLDRAFT_846795 [Exidia glandulosa HHB12029]
MDDADEEQLLTHGWFVLYLGLLALRTWLISTPLAGRTSSTTFPAPLHGSNLNLCLRRTARHHTTPSQPDSQSSSGVVSHTSPDVLPVIPSAYKRPCYFEVWPTLAKLIGTIFNPLLRRIVRHF